MAVCGLVSIGALLLCLDFWKIDGRVVDAKSGRAIPDSRILVTLHAEGLRSPVPHAWTSKVRCVGVALATSDQDGAFEIKKVSWGLGLTNKKIAIEAFKPGWYGSNQLLHSADTRLIARPFQPVSILHRASALNQNAEDQRVPPALADPADLGRHMSDSCHSVGEALVTEGLEYSSKLAKTQRERRLVRLRCQEQLNRSLLRRGVMIGTQRPLPSPWPDDVAPACEALLRDPPR
jgi:hypothetical protein